ncbi:crotonobetainyl-CoA--carnitine CoA-transferase [Actinokineospora terrae]|uniref:Uncharacterized protein n=1 Tax=Actinokineospora terrae TaxID=155974 RepID=A0A1H9X6W6_9PSEU|nr:crotonobetainyl-CoA--carnitine CoA-transferase [Actinokineospora terrae]SES41819.1 hypothetical protein SAMN04487818_11356 [Actinokineospora terrae]
MAVDLRAVASDYLARRFPGRDTDYRRPPVRVDADFCRRVARHHDQAPPRAEVGDAYRVLCREDLAQYAAIRAAGIAVRPWLGDGQPYADSRALIDQVTRTGVLWLYLTRCGHGTGTGADHPLLEPSGVEVDGEPLCHNDILRVVHDLFGHVALRAGFGPRGEFAATGGHLRLYPAEAWPALFTEQVGQICWYFHGDHLATGRPRYPEQKVFLYPQAFLDEFLGQVHPAR